MPEKQLKSTGRGGDFYLAWRAYRAAIPGAAMAMIRFRKFMMGLSGGKRKGPVEAPDPSLYLNLPTEIICQASADGVDAVKALADVS